MGICAPVTSAAPVTVTPDLLPEWRGGACGGDDDGIGGGADVQANCGSGHDDLRSGFPAAAGWRFRAWSDRRARSPRAAQVSLRPRWDRAGTVATTWVGFLAGEPAVQLAMRAPSGSFSAPLDLSPPGNEGSNGSQVAEDAAGEATVVWNASVEKTAYVVEAATVGRAGSLRAPAKLSAPGQNAIVPRGCGGRNRGDATVAWVRFDGAENIVQASYRPAVGGAFGTAVNLSAAGGSAAVLKGRDRRRRGCDGRLGTVQRRQRGRRRRHSPSGDLASSHQSAGGFDPAEGDPAVGGDER